MTKGTSKAERKSRDKEIIKLLQTGKYTLEDIGRTYGLTRERVRQIYTRATGYEHTGIERKSVRYEKAVKLLKKKLRKMKFVCKGCGKKINYEAAKGSQIFCSDCRKSYRISGRNLGVKYVCKNCGKKFNPFRNWHAPSELSKRKTLPPPFCSQKCYFESISTTGERWARKLSPMILHTRAGKKLVSQDLIRALRLLTKKQCLVVMKKDWGLKTGPTRVFRYMSFNKFMGRKIVTTTGLRAWYFKFR